MMSLSGFVQKGSGRGRVLGFPTINIPLAGASLWGIYAATVKVGEEKYEAAAYADRARGVLEAHLLDFSGDLYGWHVTIELLKKIRAERRFPDDETAKRAIAADVAAVRRYFADR